MTRPIAVLTTTGNVEEARKIAAALVERKLAACVQISEIESVYRWNGAVQNDKEWRLLVKTTDERYTAVEQAIRELHSYELPAIFSLRIENAFAPYAEWVATESSGE
jgi:periplasmic divalent cation tolerance protein